MSIISQDGGSALMLAAAEGHTEVVAQLLEAGANTDLLSAEVYTNYHGTCTVCLASEPRPSTSMRA